MDEEHPYIPGIIDWTLTTRVERVPKWSGTALWVEVPQRTLVVRIADTTLELLQIALTHAADVLRESVNVQVRIEAGYDESSVIFGIVDSPPLDGDWD
ncbi:MAG: hypothetical protein JWN17_259 [Frankiales bacterium]|nr:hypothetical protein [Frankiales bacterium]